MQTQITLNKILNNDETTLKTVRNKLKTKGWCFIKFSDYVSKTAEIYSEDFKNFFSLKPQIKEKYSYNYNIGYYDTSFKQHFKFLTGNYNVPDTRLKVFNTKEEQNMNQSANELSNFMDEIMKKLTLSPLFNLTKEKTKYLSIFGDNKAGLLDVVNYKPNINIKTNPYFVTEHVDPGLFSMNIFSSASGMQFFDPETKSWHELPSNCGVIFCGQAAKTLCGFTPAVHRVLNNGIGRLSIWYEVGVKSQLQSKDKIKKIAKQKSLEREDKIEVNVKIENTKFNELTGIPISTDIKHKIYTVPKNGTIYDIKSQIEFDFGPPMSKVVSIPKKSDEKVKSFMLENKDDTKINNIKNWKLTTNGVLMPDTLSSSKKLSVVKPKTISYEQPKQHLSRYNNLSNRMLNLDILRH